MSGQAGKRLTGKGKIQFQTKIREISGFIQKHYLTNNLLTSSIIPLFTFVFPFVLRGLVVFTILSSSKFLVLSVLSLDVIIIIIMPLFKFVISPIFMRLKGFVIISLIMRFVAFIFIIIISSIPFFLILL